MPNYLIVSALVTKIQLCSHYFLDHPRILDLIDEDMTISTPKKRTREEDRNEGQTAKKAREEERPTLPVNIRDLSERTLVNMVDTKQRVAESRIVTSEKI